jgi:ABC-type proline/glycine betaine transport system substrate-binding protein
MGKKCEWGYPYHTEEYRNQLANNAKSPQWEFLKQLELTKCHIGTNDAYIVKDVANGIVCLQSYSTIVAVAYGKKTKNLAKWTPTTSWHQNEFEAYMAKHGEDPLFT